MTQNGLKVTFWVILTRKSHFWVTLFVSFSSHFQADPEKSRVIFESLHLFLSFGSVAAVHTHNSKLQKQAFQRLGTQNLQNAEKRHFFGHSNFSNWYMRRIPAQHDLKKTDLYRQHPVKLGSRSTSPCPIQGFFTKQSSCLIRWAICEFWPILLLPHFPLKCIFLIVWNTWGPGNRLRWAPNWGVFLKKYRPSGTYIKSREREKKKERERERKEERERGRERDTEKEKERKRKRERERERDRDREKEGDG